jgi:hypothetical protein
MTRYPLYRRLCVPEGRSGRVQKISPSNGIRYPNRPAINESLYWLRYPDAQDSKTTYIYENPNHLDVSSMLQYHKQK